MIVDPQRRPFHAVASNDLDSWAAEGRRTGASSGPRCGNTRTPRPIPAAVHAKTWHRETDRAARIGSVAYWIVLATAVLIATNAWSQDAGKPAKPDAKKYEIANPGEQYFKEEAVSKMESALQSLVRGQGNARDRMVMAYFSGYLSGVLTDPMRSIEANKAIRNIRGSYERAGLRGMQETIDQLNPLIFRGASLVLQGNYYPPAKVMAVSLMSDLNQRPLDQSNARPPVPYPRATRALFNLAGDTNQTDGVRAAALAGLRRHMAVAPPSGQTAATIAQAMRQLLDEAPPAGRAPEVHAYLQRLVVDILQSVTRGQDKGYATKLVSLATDRQTPSLLALHSAATMSKVPAPSITETPAVTNLNRTLTGFSVRLLDTLRDEAKRLDQMQARPVAPQQPRDPKSFLQEEETEETTRRRPGMMGMPGGMGGTMDDMDMGGPSGMNMMGPGMDMMDGTEGMDSMYSMDMDMGMGMMGMGQVVYQPQPAEVIAARMAINYCIESLHAAVAGTPTVGSTGKDAGIIAAVEPASRDEVRRWMESLKESSEALNDRSLETQRAFREALELQIESLEATVGDAAERPEDVARLGGEMGAAKVGVAKPMGDKPLDELDQVDPLDAAAPAAGEAPAASEAPENELDDLDSL